jgi:hypothetical protein
MALPMASGTMRAQLAPGIIGDRPSQFSAISPTGRIEVASGVQLERSYGPDAREIDRTNYSYTTTFHVRYGLVENTELRAGCEYGTDFEEHARCFMLDQGVKNMAIGSKTRLQEAGEDGAPELSLFTNLRLPVSHATYRSSSVVGSQFQVDYPLNELIALTGNVGGEWRMAAGELLMTYTTTAAFALFERSSLFVDVGGEVPLGYSTAHHFDIGATYDITGRLRCDLAGGLGIYGDAPTYFFFTGFSYAP